MQSEQLLTIAYSVLIALGMLLGASLLPTNSLLTELVGTNYGFGWHTADLTKEDLVTYTKVRDSLILVLAVLISCTSGTTHLHSFT